jgi:hypothetical protein
MTKFCGSCGAAMDGGRFCPKCGSPQTVAAPAAARAKPGSPILKIVLVSVALVALLGVGGVVGAFYYVKGKVQEIAHSDTVSNLRDAVSSAAHAQRTHAGCDVLSKESAAEILNTPVVRVEGNEAGDLKEFCNYWSQPKTITKKSPEPQDDDRPDANSKDLQATLKDLENLAKNASASANGNTPLLSVQVFRGTAKVGLLSVKAASFVAGQQQRSVEGPWDEAYFGPSDALLFIRKGDNGVMLDLHGLPQAREKGLTLAKAMVQGI